MRSIAIIGAGLTGITLARQLQSCARVSVFEQSPGVGGRMATHYSGPYQFDSGAQFFTARSKQFQNLLREFAPENLIQAWEPRVLTLQPDKKPFKREWFEPHFVAAPGMHSLCTALAENLDVTVGTRVSAIEGGAQGWILHESTGRRHGPFDWIACTLPAPAAHELLPGSFSKNSELEEVRFSACFSLMLGLKSAPKFNFDAAVIKNSPLAWIAADCSKPDRPSEYSLLVHSDNAWAESRLESSADEVQEEMLEAIVRLLVEPLPSEEHVALHRWRYARAETCREESFLLDEPNRLAACGDWCGGGRVEDAFLSGLKLSEQLRSLWHCEA